MRAHGKSARSELKFAIVTSNSLLTTGILPPNPISSASNGFPPAPRGEASRDVARGRADDRRETQSWPASGARSLSTGGFGGMPVYQVDRDS